MSKMNGYFRGLVIVIAIGFSPLSGKIASALKKFCAEYWLKKKIQKSIDKCTGSRYITEITLKTALKIIQFIN